MIKLREKDIILTKNKCEFYKDNLEYYGYIFAGEEDSLRTYQPSQSRCEN